MQTYDFEMTSRKFGEISKTPADAIATTVAKGTASATMVYEFQKAFLEFNASPTYRRGEFISLDSILSMPVDCSDCWQVIDVDGTISGFWFQRIN